MAEFIPPGYLSSPMMQLVQLKMKQNLLSMEINTHTLRTRKCYSYRLI